VSAVGLGFWQFGAPEWNWGPDFGEAAAKPIVRRALDLGINLFDTAEIYGRGRSEEILGKALGDRRSEAFIASKVSPRHAGRASVREAAEGSLRRLGIERIDLFQLHWPNRFVPLAQTMGGMRDLVRSGKISLPGVSNFSVRGWRRADKAFGGVVPANQVQFNLLDRGPMADLLPFAREHGRAIIAYSPLAQGLVGGKYDKDHIPADFRAGYAMFSRSNFERLAPLMEALREVANAHRATPAQVSLAWLLHMPNVVVIPGARSIEQVEANAAAADLVLSDDEWRHLDVLAASAEQTLPVRTRVKRLLLRMMGW
jgi:aryl-alcohol dehydrogenase-like predicted oxidoreductase